MQYGMIDPRRGNQRQKQTLQQIMQQLSQMRAGGSAAQGRARASGTGFGARMATAPRTGVGARFFTGSARPGGALTMRGAPDVFEGVGPSIRTPGAAPMPMAPLPSYRPQVPGVGAPGAAAAQPVDFDYSQSGLSPQQVADFGQGASGQTGVMVGGPVANLGAPSVPGAFQGGGPGGSALDWIERYLAQQGVRIG